MRTVAIEDLKPGMTLGYTIYSSDGRVLLRAGVVLNDNYINYLIRMKIPVVGVFDDSDYEKQPILKDVVNRKTRLAAVAQVKNVLLESQESGRLVIEPESLYGTVGELTDQLLSNRELIFNLVDLRSQDDYTFAHSVNVCVLSLMTGITMGYQKRALSILGVGALLHDLGKVKIPDSILNKPGPLTEAEFEIIKTHTVHGADMIRKAGNLDEIHALMALQHHENYDGSGYPFGLSRDRIEEYSQIVAIADRFDAITADRVYRKPYPPVEAFAMCEASANYFVKESVTRAFIYNIAAYPANTVVELNNGMVGVALVTPKGSSLYPKVKVYFDEKHSILSEPFELPLHETEGVYVVRVLESL